MSAFENAMRNAVRDEARSAAREHVVNELHKILNVRKFGEQIIAEQLGDALLNRATVETITALSRAELDRLLTAGAFPRPVRLDASSLDRWFLTEVAAWIAARREGRDEAQRRQDAVVAQAAFVRMAQERREREAHAALAKAERKKAAQHSNGEANV